MKKIFLQIAALALAFVTAGCSDDKQTNPAVENPADMVVYGNVYTVEDETPQAEAFAVKDGKYIYVGDMDGIKAYVGEKTTVVDHRGKGMITPGFADCHAHYLMSEGMNVMGALTLSEEVTPAEFLTLVSAAYAKAKADGKPAIYAFGWGWHNFESMGMPTLKQLDAVCPDLPLYAADSEGHKGLANTACLIKAGIIDANGNLKITHIKGGKICVDDKGHPTGVLMEQAGTYCRLKGIDYDALLDASMAITTVRNVNDTLISKGFVSYQDGWSNFYGNTRFYEAAKALDEEGKLNISLGLAYEIESSTSELDNDLAKAFDTRKYSSRHVNPRYIKMFVDGTVETFTGYVHTPYLDGTYGIANWTLEDFSDVTARVNQNDYTMHVHAMGDEAIHLAVTAFASSGKKEMRNTLVHVRNVLPEDYATMAANDIVCASSIIWHFLTDSEREMMTLYLPKLYADEMYPMRSFYDHGVTMTSHSDFPALASGSEMPFYLMENAVTCVNPLVEAKPYWTEEALTRQQVLKALTINGAFQMHNEQERGSIKVGKYADFVIVDKDVMSESCPVNQIHNANVTSTYFEGKQVYPKK